MTRMLKTDLQEEIEKYHKENNQELIVVLSAFVTDEKGGDGGSILMIHMPTGNGI